MTRRIEPFTLYFKQFIFKAKFSEKETKKAFNHWGKKAFFVQIRIKDDFLKKVKVHQNRVLI